MNGMFIRHGVIGILASLAQLVWMVAGIIAGLQFFHVIGGDFMSALITAIVAFVVGGLLGVAAFANLTLGAAREFRF